MKFKEIDPIMTMGISLFITGLIAGALFVGAIASLGDSSGREIKALESKLDHCEARVSKLIEKIKLKKRKPSRRRKR